MTRRSRWLEIARIAALVVFGTALGLHYARMGFMPLDQSISFDGGWRILNGEVPFRDYTAPNGFPVHALQAAFFALFGVNWLAYCLHAAVFNGLFAALVDRLLLLVGSGRWISSAFALLSAVVFYPPFGLPYMDQHAFFFSLAALVAALAAARGASERSRAWSAYAVGPLLLLAYLSKQIPSSFFLPAAAAAALWTPHGRWRTLARVAIGGAGALAALLALGAALGVDWGLVRTYWWELPSQEGARRLSYVPSLEALAARAEETRKQLGLRMLAVAAMVAVAGALALAVTLLARRVRGKNRDSAQRALSGSWACFLVASFLPLASLLFISWTSNQRENGLSLVFAAAGAIAAGLEALRRLAIAAGRRRLALAPLAAILALVALSADDARLFDKRINATRRVSDLKFKRRDALEASASLPASLSPLLWAVPPKVPYSAADFAAVLEFLREQPEPFFLLGDCGILYGLAGKPSIPRSLWFHPGLTFPRPYDEGFDEYERDLVARIQSAGVHRIVVEGDHTWVGYARDPDEAPPKAAWVTLDTFPRLAALVAARQAGERSFGAFRVIELRPEP